MKKIIPKKIITLLGIISFSGIGFATLTSPLSAEKEIFMGPDFAMLMCRAWNRSALPRKLATKKKGGNGWIAVENKYTGKNRGKQAIVMSRRDCPRISRVQLTISNMDGMAICTYGGRMKVAYRKAEWAFAPRTEHWFDFASGGWGMWAMRKLMKGMRGPMTTAFSNRHNFGIFWKITGRLAKNINADYTSKCSLDSDTIKDIQKYLKKI